MKLFGYEIVKKDGAKEIKGYHMPDYGSFQGMVGMGNGLDLSRSIKNFYLMYRINSDLRRCIQEIQQTAGKDGYRLTLHVSSSDYDKEIIDPEVDKILSFGKGFNCLKNEILKHYLISGNVFVEKLYASERSYKVVWYNVLDSRYMSIVCDPNYNPIRYLYQDLKNNRTIEYSPESLLHFGDNIDYDNPAFYMSLLEGIVPDVFGDDQASISNAYFFQNDAMPSSLYILEEGLTIEQQQQVMEFIKMQFSGGHNKHKNLVSGNVRDIKPISQSHTDMDYLNQRKFTSERICACMGVPRIILNYTEWVNYSNAETQYRKFIENTVRPIEHFLESVFAILIEPVNARVVFEIIDDHIDDKLERTDVAIKNVTAWLWNRNEAREYIGDEPVDSDMMNEYTVSTTTIPLELAMTNALQTPDEEINNLKNGPEKV
jgi:HK97 family phage portal protein